MKIGHKVVFNSRPLKFLFTHCIVKVALAIVEPATIKRKEE